MEASPNGEALGQCPTHNSTVTLPCGMFSQYPSNDLWWSSWGFPDGQLLYTAASIVIGTLYSFPLNLKNHRLHFLKVPLTLVFPWNETLIAVSDCSLLNEQSYKKCYEYSLRVVKKKKLMMTLYFSCLLECTELLIDIFSSAAFLKSLFQRWPWHWL